MRDRRGAGHSPGRMSDAYETSAARLNEGRREDSHATIRSDAQLGTRDAGAVENAGPTDVHCSMGCEGPRERAGRGRRIRRKRARGAFGGLPRATSGNAPEIPEKPTRLLPHF